MSLPLVMQDGTYSYLYGLGLIASIDGSGTEIYHLYDGLGSVSELTDDSGVETDSYVYDAFGAVTSSTGSTSNDWLFTGEQNDGETELYFLRARYYDPETGRFLGRDPIEFAQRYAYAGNNPVAYTDPSGLEYESSSGPALYGLKAYMSDHDWDRMFGFQDYYGENDWLDRVPKYREPERFDTVEIDANGCVVGDQLCVREGLGGQQGIECTGGGACYSDEHIDLNPIRPTHGTAAIGPLGEAIGDGAGQLYGFATSRTLSCYTWSAILGTGTALVVFPEPATTSFGLLLANPAVQESWVTSCSDNAIP